RVTATGARLARVLQEWMTHGWIETPDEFCQGSSIMPQKKNPVVLEHLCSMAAATAGDAATVLNSVGLAWYEDSNNATTDVQAPLWRSLDRTHRFLALMHRLLDVLAPASGPDDRELVDSGTTTTMVAERLSQAGVPWRAAHHVVGALT